MSIAERKICKPLVKPSIKITYVVLVLFIIKATSICFMVCFDLLVLKMPQNGHSEPKLSLSTYLFVVFYAVFIVYLSSESFYKALFCSMNMKEKICESQANYRYQGALHTIEDPIYVSAPCKLFSVGNVGLKDSDILDINESVSPCSLELRSNFFIENFQMNVSVNSNDFVLLDGEVLNFKSHIDFHSWSKVF